MLLEAVFGDLDGVECGALAKLIACHDEHQPAMIGHGWIVSDASDEDVVVVGGGEGGGEDVLLGVVDEADAGGIGEGGSRVYGIDGLLEFACDGFEVRSGDGYAHAGCDDVGVWVGEDFARFVEELVFLVVEAGIVDGGVVAEDVEGAGFAKDVGFGAFAGEDGPRLGMEFVEGSCTGAADGLIGCDDGSPEVPVFVQGPECECEDDC